MTPEEYLRYLPRLIDPEADRPWDADQTYGLFGHFRPAGMGVEAVFAPLAHGAEYLARLRPIYAATADPECARDAYFIVRRPRGVTQTELDQLGQAFLAHLRSLADVIGDAELDAVLDGTRRIEHRAIRMEDFDTDEHLTVSETIGDWLGGHADEEDPIDVLREAYYSLAADDWLAHHLQWPRYAELCPIDVFAPYAELWHAGLSCVFRAETLVIGPLVSDSRR
jgi:hypothetical protein